MVTTLTRPQINALAGLTAKHWERRHDEVMIYLNEFMNVTERCDKKRYYYDIEGEVPESIPKMPRKSNMPEKIADYTQFTLAALGTEFKPNSKARIAQDAIDDFGYNKYGHISKENIARNFVGPVMDEKGEKSKDMYWVNFSTYEIITDEQLVRLKELFKQERISEKEMANAFIKSQQGEDISQESTSFQRAISLFKDEFGFTPIKVYQWKIKS